MAQAEFSIPHNEEFTLHVSDLGPFRNHGTDPKVSKHCNQLSA